MIHSPTLAGAPGPPPTHMRVPGARTHMQHAGPAHVARASAQSRQSAELGAALQWNSFVYNNCRPKRTARTTAQDVVVGGDNPHPNVMKLNRPRQFPQHTCTGTYQEPTLQRRGAKSSCFCVTQWATRCQSTVPSTPYTVVLHTTAHGHARNDMQRSLQLPPPGPQQRARTRRHQATNKQQVKGGVKPPQQRRRPFQSTRSACHLTAGRSEAPHVTAHNCTCCLAAPTTA